MEDIPTNSAPKANLITLKEAAVRMRRTEKFVRKLCQQGQLPGAIPSDIDIWLIPIDSIDDWMKANRRSTIFIIPLIFLIIFTIQGLLYYDQRAGYIGSSTFLTLTEIVTRPPTLTERATETPTVTPIPPNLIDPPTPTMTATRAVLSISTAPGTLPPPMTPKPTAPEIATRPPTLTERATETPTVTPIPPNLIDPPTPTMTATRAVLSKSTAPGTLPPPMTPKPTVPEIATPLPTPTFAQIPISTDTPSASEIVQAELDRLEQGILVFNPPGDMRVGEIERIEVRVQRDISGTYSVAVKTGLVTSDSIPSALVSAFAGRGVPTIEPVKISTFMSAKLTGRGNGFEIKALSDEEQVVGNDDFTQWSWDVMPLVSGKQQLHLEVKVRIKVPDSEETKSLRVMDKEVSVRVNPLYTSQQMVSNYWQWLTTIIVLPLVGWAYSLWLNRKKAGVARKPSAKRSTTPTRAKAKPTIKILFLAANPKDREHLQLDVESREVESVLEETKYRDAFVVHKQFAVRVGDIQKLLLKYEPTIVHFAGHGNEVSEIVVQDDQENSYPIPVEDLSNLFSILNREKRKIRYVVLNACYSEAQALAIAEHVDCVVGMSNQIADKASLEFAKAFYQALGYGQSAKAAFDLAQSRLKLMNMSEYAEPMLHAKDAREAAKPLVTD